MKFFVLTLLVLALLHYTASETRVKRNCINNNCNTGCNGGSCNTGCRGGSCNNGCSGGSCNSGCTTPSCNSCVTSCQNNCQTVNCQSNCVNYCANSCSGNSCAASTPSCVSNCCNTCSSSECVNSCTQNCQQPVEPKPQLPVPVIIESNPQPQVVERPVIVNNTNINQANHTAHIHINNVINNTNVIHVPVYVNTTNYNNIELSQPQQPVNPQPEYRPIIYPPSNNGIIEVIKVLEKHNITNTEIEKENPTEVVEKNCCYVIHPRVCQVLPTGERKCYIKRHRECSDICSSSVVMINGEDQVINYPPPIINFPPQPPIYIYPRIPRPLPPNYIYIPQNTPCQRIQQYPWSYCGANQQVQSCGSCYECDGMYNPQQCSQSAGCSEQCRLNMFSCGSNNVESYCV